MERGRREYRFVPSELNGLMRATLKSMDYPVHIGGFRLRKAFAPGLLPLKCDPDALGEALANLLANSLKYSGARKELAVSTLSVGDMVGVRVQDWGIGIPPEEQARIFEPYYRSPREKALQAGGVGLGLALVKSIVDAHGGNVDLVSVPGQGSVFTLWFPRAVVPSRAAR
jgi:signal transduction histidine kinase